MSRLVRLHLQCPKCGESGNQDWHITVDADPHEIKCWKCGHSPMTLAKSGWALQNGETIREAVELMTQFHDRGERQ